MYDFLCLTGVPCLHSYTNVNTIAMPCAFIKILMIRVNSTGDASSDNFINIQTLSYLGLWAL